MQSCCWASRLDPARQKTWAPLPSASIWTRQHRRDRLVVVIGSIVGHHGHEVDGFVSIKMQDG